MSEQQQAAQETTNAAPQTGEATANAEAVTSQQNASAEASAEASNNNNAEGEKSTETEKVVPEKYELKVPEGSKLSAIALSKIESYAKEQGMTNEEAQALVDRDHAVVDSYYQESQQQLMELNNKTWKTELFEDPEFGGESFEENGHIAHKAASTWFGEEFAEDLKAMHMNHNPKLFRGLVRIGKAMANDKLIQAGNARGEKSIEEVLYGTN